MPLCFLISLGCHAADPQLGDLLEQGTCKLNCDHVLKKKKSNQALIGQLFFFGA